MNHIRSSIGWAQHHRYTSACGSRRTDLDGEAKM